MSEGRCLILGGRGFIGSALTAEAHRRGWQVTAVGSRNSADVVGGSFDLVINANGNSRKYWAQQHPAEDFDASVRTVARSLQEIRAARYLYLSSSEVYADPSDPQRNAEDTPYDPSRLSPYGFHKYLAELLVRRYAHNWAILRLSGLVGPHLRKNSVYDLLNGRPLHVHPDSEFQFVDTRYLARLAFDLLERGALDRTELNIGGEGVVSVREIASWIGRPLSREEEKRPRTRCELCLERLRRWVDIPATKETVRAFVREWQGKGGAL